MDDGTVYDYIKVELAGENKNVGLITLNRPKGWHGREEEGGGGRGYETAISGPAH